MHEEYAFSQRRACGLMPVAVSTYRYQTRRTDEPLRTRLVELAREKLRFGYRRLYLLLRRGGGPVNHKRVHRISGGRAEHPTEESETLRARGTSAAGLDRGESGVGAGPRARCSGLRVSHPHAERGGRVHTGVSGLGSGHQLREPKSDASVGRDRGRAGQPLAIRCDNRPELTSRHFLASCVERQIELAARGASSDS